MLYRNSWKGCSILLYQIRGINSTSSGEMPWLQTGATHCHAQLGLSDKGRAIKRLVVCNSLDLGVFGLAKRSDPRLLSTVP